MLRWLTSHEYSRLDLIWIAWDVLAWHDRNYVAMLLAIIVGATLSASVEVWVEHRVKAQEQPR